MITVRPATPDDEATLGRFGGALVRQHHADDPRRFLQVTDPEAGYGRYLVSRISRPDARVLVAERDGHVVGYVYAEVEPVNWSELRGPAGVIHDVFVEAGARHRGAGRALMEAVLAWIGSRERSQVVLSTKTRNESAQRLFASLGFRPTMIEMALDLDGAPPGR